VSYNVHVDSTPSLKASHILAWPNARPEVFYDTRKQERDEHDQLSAKQLEEIDALKGHLTKLLEEIETLKKHQTQLIEVVNNRGTWIA
jgi:hypothetical protein